MYLLSKTQKFIAIVDHNDKKDIYLNNELITGSGTPCPYANAPVLPNTVSNCLLKNRF